MRSFRLASLFLSSLAISVSLAAQQPPQRDPQAVAVLQQSLRLMGATAPSDSVATGIVVVEAGSMTENGTIRILTRGLDQSAEQLRMPSGNRAVIYSRGLANETDGTTVAARQLELGATSQSPVFPFAILAGALSNPDVALQYVGLETLDGASAHHLRYWNSFSSNPRFQKLAEFSVKDLWIDVVSGLPHKLAYDRRAGSGAVPRIPVAVSFTDYRNVGGVLYPFLIKKSLIGTPWTTITIQSVALNTGLSDTDFPVR